MSKKKIFLLCSALCLTLCSIAFLLYWQGEKSYAFRQVKKIAPSPDNYLLPFKHHISQSIRPQETFTFPIALGTSGPSNSLYSGTKQYPFYCMTIDSNLGQPLVDNQEGFGVPVYQSIALKEKIIGYSKDCNVQSQLLYFTISSEGKIDEYSFKQSSRTLTKHDKLFRVEQGTINRFVYTLIMPITTKEVGNRLAKSQWNKRLIYQFNGGSGIGYRQGRQTAPRVMKRQVEQLRAGYAVISSSGNRTSYTYNMLLAEDTARRVKKQFTSLYGQPLYTVGIGGSGGGLAQYLIAQNSTGILDGLIPLYSYPDMISQTIYALDCDLLNNYFTFRAKDRATWNDWEKRQQIEGMNARNNFPQRTGYLQPVNQFMAGFIPSLPKGNNECINGYFGLSSYINNPKQGFIRNFFHPEVVEKTHWSYWQDLQQLLGNGTDGFAASTWDNVGVQYGLSALLADKISIANFIDINQKIGGWKPQSQMTAESILTPLGRKMPLWLSLWGNHNITKVIQNVAPRHQGSIKAMHAAYRSGQVFIGKVTLPIIDVRHYLEDDLDMHHVSASFYSRLRITKANGHSDNHVIWLSDKAYNPAGEAFDLMDQWLLAKNGNKLSDVIDAKPTSLTDTCFDHQGEVIAQGVGIFNGAWNANPQNLGRCQQVFPMYGTSRIQAGGTWSGDIFKCQLIPVERAITQGLYRQHDLTNYKTLLKRIFPQGVCDYSAADLGRPSDI